MTLSKQDEYLCDGDTIDLPSITGNQNHHNLPSSQNNHVCTRSLLMTKLSGLILTTTACYVRSTLAMPTSLSGLLTPLFPKRGSTIQDELRCYSLPYGAIGFASHCLTYYTLYMLSRGRSPILLRRLKATIFDLMFAGLQLLVTVILAAVNIARCHDRWQFVLISIWKLCFSLELGTWGITSIIVVRRNDQYHSHKHRSEGEENTFTRPAAYMVVVYIIPVLVGAVGLLHSVSRTIEDLMVLQVTIAFGVIIEAVAAIAVFCFVMRLLGAPEVRIIEDMENLTVPFNISSLSCLILFAFYSDWVLGAMAGNLVGLPGSDNATLYWSYFLAKRLPLFTT